LEALLFTGRPFAPVFFEDPLVGLGDTGASSDAGDKCSSFMAAGGGRFPQIQGSSLDDPKFQRFGGIMVATALSNQQQLPVRN
jgi:hypothetical protein